MAHLPLCTLCAWETIKYAHTHTVYGCVFAFLLPFCRYICAVHVIDEKRVCQLVTCVASENETQYPLRNILNNNVWAGVCDLLSFAHIPELNRTRPESNWSGKCCLSGFETVGLLTSAGGMVEHVTEGNEILTSPILIHQILNTRSRMGAMGGNVMTVAWKSW